MDNLRNLLEMLSETKIVEDTIKRTEVYEAINSDITLLELRIADLDRTRKNQDFEESEPAKVIRAECLAKIEALLALFQSIVWVVGSSPAVTPLK
jgi:hypothetical protein